MAEQKTIAVIGATGAQGGGLVRAILADESGAFRARAVTRNPDSDKARALADAGAEVVKADLDDVDSLARAFEGCYGAFCVTNFWEHFSPEKEMAQAKNLADAAKRAGVRHVVWSTLEDVRRWVPLDDDRMPTLMERFKVPHFDAKGASDHHFTDQGVPTTFLLTSFYWDNLLYFGMEPQRGEDGALVFALPMGDAKLAAIAAEDIGKCAFGIFAAGDTYVGETVGIAGEHLTGSEMAAALSESLGEDVTYYAVPFDTYRAFDFPGAEDLGNMFQFYHDFNDDFSSARSVEFSRSLNPSLLSFRAWLKKHGERIPRH
ncbi:MAG: nucleoside-diphosphate sugar epimerase [Gemmatimonas sp. SG8_23]|nr:MAG: nucleoside-diphosphate sugar epimerase [Gemmatimonas sp. SG8_23]